MKNKWQTLRQLYRSTLVLRNTLIALLAFTSCGFNGNQRLSVNDSLQSVTLSGEAFTYIVVRLEFIDEIKILCQDLHFDIPDAQVRNKTVAECTFDRLTLLNFDFGSLLDVQNELCQQDPSTLTPDQLQVYNTICAPELTP